MNKISKSNELLKKIAQKGVATEESLLEDTSLTELFGWNTKRSPRARIKDTLAILSKQGSLVRGVIDTERIYKITTRGKAQIERFSVRHRPTLEHISDKAWNGRWFFVTYQIPESHKISRNQLLIELKRLGFLRFSSALWIYPHDVSPQIRKIAKHLDIDKHIDILRADTISQPVVWRRRFKIK